MEQNQLLSARTASLASLISKPDNDLIDALNSGRLYRLLAASPGLSEHDTELFRDRTYRLEDLTELYMATMEASGHLSLQPIESVYKQWTDDAESYPLLYGKKGLLMGDPALHMLELYRRFGIEIPEDFSGQPDHLILELEFLSFLYENGNDTMVCQFIKDHLDWVPDLIAKCDALNPAPFYCSALRMLDGFIKHERSRLESLCEVKV